MTTTALTPPSIAQAPSRVLAVLRLHFASRYILIGAPWAIMAIIFVVNLAVWAIIFASVSSPTDRAEVTAGLQWSGASLYLFVWMSIVAVQSIMVSFPFALGYGVTRRDYYLGTSLTYVLLSVGYATVLTLLAGIEQATDGWGLGGQMFNAVYFAGDTLVERFFVFLALLLFFYFSGALGATVYLRWKQPGLLAAFAALGVLIVGLCALVTISQSWQRVFEFATSVGTGGLVALLLIPTAIAALTGYGALRRATPKN